MDHLEIMVRALNDIKINRKAIIKFRKKIDKLMTENPRVEGMHPNRVNTLYKRLQPILKNGQRLKQMFMNDELEFARAVSDMKLVASDDIDIRIDELCDVMYDYDRLMEKNAELCIFAKQVGKLCDAKLYFSGVYPNRIRRNGNTISVTKFIVDQLAEDTLLGDDDE
jgi:hypothetical protein